MTDDSQLTAAVRQCRQHIDDIGTEAQSMERLLSDLQTATPQRQAVLEAVQKLDSLRQHINATQQLLFSVDATLQQACDQQIASQSPSQQATGSTPPSRSELLQRELGRLNSRLCCTVLALERATSKAICRGTQSGVVTTARSAADRLTYCCASGLQKFASSTASDQAYRHHPQAVTSQSVPDKNASVRQRTTGLCEQWLNSQQQQLSIPPLVDKTQSCETIEKTVVPDDGVVLEQTSGALRTADSMPTDTQHDTQNVSLKEIHRMLGNIISNIDQPEKDELPDGASLPPAVHKTPAVQEEAQRRAEEVASNSSVMTDSVVASSTDLHEVLLAAHQTQSKTRDGPLALHTLPSDATGFDDKESCT